MTTPPSNNVHIRRLYWQCRRGLLELDLLLIPFLEQVYPSLTQQEQKQFEVLLNYADPELNAWFLGSASPPEALNELVKKIREHAKTRHQN